MAFIIKDRVKEGTVSTGTGAVTLGGASATFDPFNSYMVNGDTTYYAIVHTTSGTDEWEVGIGTWNTGNTLTRTTILSGSNGTSAVDFSAGTKDVFMTYPASKAAIAGEDVTFADITVTGTVDGRDVAADGTKLDGIDTSADVTDATTVAAAGALMKSGGTMTGNLILNADPTAALGAATKEYVDTIASAGIHYHDPVRVETPSALTSSYNNGSSGVGATLTNSGTQAALVIDGVTMALNDRVLVYNQTNEAHNGIYTVTNVGSASTNWVMTRATDADSYGASDPDSFGKGDAFFVKEGNTGAGELYVMTTAGTITFGTTAIHFSQVAETAVYNAGTGVTLNGTTFSIGQDVGTAANVTFNQVTAAIIGNVTGNLTGDVTGNAGTATALATARTIQLTGDVTGSATFDGSANASITAVVQDDSHSHVISNVDGLQAALDGKTTTSRTITAGNGLTGGGNLTANRTLNVGAGTGVTVNADTVAIGQPVETTSNVTFADVTADVFIAEGGTATSTYDSPADVSLVTTRADYIYVEDAAGNYLRKMLGQNTAGVIEVGQGGTSLITGINLRPGNSGQAQVNGVQIITDAGSGLTKSGDTLSHSDTSSQASVNNSSGTVIQDITLDTYGHITGINSVNLDGRYYTESEINTRMTYTLYNPQNAPSDLNSVSHRGWYRWASSSPTNAPYAYGMLIDGKDGGQPQQLVQTYGGSSNKVSLYGRRRTNGNWDTTWTQYFSDHYHPNADKWTTARTLSLSGDASGSVSWDGSANATLSVTVANDSHTHDGRYYTESEADSRFVNVTGDTMSGDLVLEDSELHVGNKSADSWTRIKHTSVDSYGFNFQHDNASVIVNEQGGTNQALVLGDVDATNNSGLFGVSHLQGGGSWQKKLDLRGNGDLYIGSSGTSRVFHDGYRPNADKWTTARTLSLSGDASGSVSWDGSANATLSVNITSINNSVSLGGHTLTDAVIGYHNLGSTQGGNPYPYRYFRITSDLTFDNNRAYELFIDADDNGGYTGIYHIFISQHANTGNMDRVRFSHVSGQKGIGELLVGTDEHVWVRATQKWGSVRIRALHENEDVSAMPYATTTTRPATQTSSTEDFEWNGDTNAYYNEKQWNARNDGSGSGLDADLLDGVQGSSFLRSDANDTCSGAITFTNGNGIYFVDGNTRVDRGSGNSLRVQTNSGWVDVGPQNTGWMHFQTDRSQFYFNRQIRVDGSIGIYNNSTYLTGNDMHLHGVIYHYGDTNTYMQFHAADQWRVVTGGAERLEVNNSQITSTEPIHAPSFHGNGSGLTNLISGLLYAPWIASMPNQPAGSVPAANSPSTVGAYGSVSTYTGAVNSTLMAQNDHMMVRQQTATVTTAYDPGDGRIVRANRYRKVYRIVGS